MKNPLQRASVCVSTLLVVMLAGCAGEESDVPQPQPAPRSEATGTVTDGQNQLQTVVGKGAAGLPRHTRSYANGSYTLSFTDLTGPYLLANTLSPGSNPDLAMLTSVATDEGVVNITPLTTLLTSQLLGLAPGTAYSTFSAAGSTVPSRVTSSAIESAQAEVTQLLRDVYDVQVETGSASFVTSPFSAVEGDDMFDTIRSLNAQLVAHGVSLHDLAGYIASGVQACEVESLMVSVGGATRRFCPLTKSALPDEEDEELLLYTFANVRNEVLVVRVREGAVVEVSFTTTAGASSTCVAPACAGPGLGVPGEDDTLPMNFAGTNLAGAAGPVTLSGQLIGAQPFVTLPNLPCADNRFIAIFDDGTALGDCVSTDDPFGVGGTYGGPVGPARESFSAANNNDPRPDFPRVQIGLDTSTAVPTVTYVYYADSDPDTFETRSQYACQFMACNSVTIGEAAATTALGYQLEYFNITLDDTVLTGMQPDGTATDRSLALRASFTLVRETGMMLQYPPRVDCTSPADTLAVTVGEAEFNLCMPPNDVDNGFIYRVAYDMGGMMGIETQLVLDSESYDRIVINLAGDEVLNATVVVSSTGEQFSCAGACAGVNVSAPDAQGARTVDFSDGLMRLDLPFPRPGDRVLSLSGGGLVVPAP